MKNRTAFHFSLLLFLSFFVFSLSANAQSEAYNPNSGVWLAPASSDSFKNPFRGNPRATAAGKKLYTAQCLVCHGNKGKGDGVGAVALKPKPGNFTTSKVQAQTDGALYWKITEGRGAMVSYKETLTDQQRWQLVNYLRTLRKK